jgi:RNA polymerase sigma-70 factor (ECF subfamily)
VTSKDVAEDPDDALIARALEGDAVAYEVLMRRHFEEVHAVAARLTERAEDAEDACQEAFTRAYFRLDRCRDRARFREWLLQLTRHHAHNVRRYQALRAATSLEDAPAAAAAAAMAVSASNDAELSELRARLHRALATLSPIKRAVIRHHDVDGWTHPQVARALSISVLMSRRHLSDARAALRAQLGEVARDFLQGDGDDG